MDTTNIPKSFGECVDMLEVIKEKKIGLKRQTDELDKYASMIKDDLKIQMDLQGLTECAGTNMRIRFVTKTKYSLSSKEMFCQYILNNKAFDVMMASCNQSAIRDRLEEGEEIPGLATYDLVTASLTKRL